MANAARKPIPQATELSVLDQSRRRCTLCFHLKNDLIEKRGQLAHLDHDPANLAEDNLAFLCLAHHSLYDSRTSQQKNYTSAELKAARARLYAAIRGDHHINGRVSTPSGRETDREALDALIELMTATDTMKLLRGASFADWSFAWHEVDALDQFVRESAGAEREFIDQDLERLRKDLVAAGGAFISIFLRNTRHAPWSFGYRIVPQDWEKQEPQRYYEAVRTLRGAADKVCAIYDELVRLGRARLAP